MASNQCQQSYKDKKLLCIDAYTWTPGVSRLVKDLGEDLFGDNFNESVCIYFGLLGILQNFAILFPNRWQTCGHFCPDMRFVCVETRGG